MSRKGRVKPGVIQAPGLPGYLSGCLLEALDPSPFILYSYSQIFILQERKPYNMNSQLKRRMRACLALSSAFILSISALPVYADDSVESLQDKTSSLQNELNGLNSELDTISSELDTIITQMENVTSQVEQSKTDLAAAKADEAKRYEDMKIRIRYMYEEGQTSMLDILFTSVSMADFLNKADFIRNVSEYDRAMLDKLIEVRKDIEEKETALQQEQESLVTLQGDLENKQNELTEKISSTSGELSVYSAQLEKAVAAAKAAEEALRREAEAAAQAQQQAQAETPPSSDQQTGENRPPSESQTPGGSDTTPPSGSGNSSGGSSYPAEASEIDLFAAILQCEAGTSNYDGLLAVATVIMNRVESSRYPNTIKGVIYQSGQFSPVQQGKLDIVLNKGAASLCYQVANDALGGARYAPVSNCYQFRAAGSYHQGVTIGGNVFF